MIFREVAYLRKEWGSSNYRKFRSGKLLLGSWNKTNPSNWWLSNRWGKIVWHSGDHFSAHFAVLDKIFDDGNHAVYKCIGAEVDQLTIKNSIECLHQ